MKKIVFLIVFLNSLLFAMEIPERCSTSINCKSCHSHIVKDWEKSWHARSHIEKNEYFRKSLAYVARHTYKSIEATAVECAQCHNPRIGISELKEFDDIDHAFNIKNKNSRLIQATHDDKIKEGINCIVCHKIATIEDKKEKSELGNSILTWLEPGIIGGPFDDSKSSFHQSKQQNFFNDPDRLCLVCHARMDNELGYQIAATGDEYQKSKSGEKCVDCHMSEKIDGVASYVANTDGVVVNRQIRRHKFAGAHSKHIIKKALKVALKSKKAYVDVVLTNPNPHNVPTGFGGRELLIEAFFEVAGTTKVEKMSLTQEYTSKHGRDTIPHMAKKATKYNGVKAHSNKTIRFKRPVGATKVTVKVWYKLVNDKIKDLLELEELRWGEKRLIKEVELLF